jgi:hypothetical protein
MGGGALRLVPLVAVVGAVTMTAGPGVGHSVAALAAAVPGSIPCREQPPLLLSPGRVPRAPLRIDLAKLASTTATAVSTEKTDAETHLADGSLRPSSTTEKVRVRLKTGRLRNGRLPVTEQLTLSYVGRPDPAQTVNLSGYSDALDGGVFSGKVGTSVTVTDRLPREPVGVGATWRVVNCDPIGSVYAFETRTYTLRSVTQRVVTATYRDVLEIDPAHVALGSLNVRGTTVQLQLVQLHGTAVGTWRLPLANGLGESRTTVTRMETVARSTGAGIQTALIHVSTVDTESDPAAR